MADQQRHRLYVSCGDVHVDVFQEDGGSYSLLEEIDTAAGARTALFDQKSGAYYLAVPGNEGQEAAIWVYHAQ